MFREFTIESYRGLRGITLSNLRRINIIIGENNSGKTSVLEAVQLFDSRDVLSNVIAIAKKRESPLMTPVRNRMSPFDLLWYSFDMQEEERKEIYVTADSEKFGLSRVGVRGEMCREWDMPEDCTKADWERYEDGVSEDGGIYVLHGEYIYEYDGEEHGKFYFNEFQRTPTIYRDYGIVKKSGVVIPPRMRHMQYISPMDIYTGKTISASLYKGMLVEERRRLLELLRMFDERIIGVEMGMHAGGPITFIEMDGCGMMPVSVFGDGLKKVLTLASAITRMRSGVVLIDEFETGIHKRALVQVARWLAAVTRRYEVQVFLTTHSSEAIDALVEAQGDYDDISAYRLEHYRDSVYVKRFQGEDLHQLKTNQGMDIL